jgi:hypothetical protein
MQTKIWSGALFLAGAFALLGACSGDSRAPDEPKPGSIESKLIQVPVVSGNVTTIAGTGTPGSTDAAVATNGTLNDPSSVTTTPDGAIYIADRGNNSIRRIKPDGSLDTFIGGQPNLLKDPGAEVFPYPSAWFNYFGSWPSTQQCTGTSGCTLPPAEDGNRFFGSGTAGNNLLVQSVDVSAYATAIAAGKQRFRFSGFIRAQAPDSSEIQIEYVDAANHVVGSYYPGPQSPGVWTEVIDERVAPTTTTKISVWLIARTAAAAGNAFFDSLELRALPTTPPVGENLIRNWSGEVFPYTEWSATNGTFPVRNGCSPATAGCPSAVEGTRYFGGSGPVASQVQMVDVSAFSTAIAAGTQKFHFSGLYSTVGTDTAEFQIEYVDATNHVVGAFYPGPRQSTSGWTEIIDERFAPTTTTRVGIWMVGRTTTPQQMAYFDGLSFRAMPVAGAPPPADAGLIEPKSIERTCVDNGSSTVCSLYIAAANGLFVANTSDGSVNRVQPSGTYFPPAKASSVTLGDGSIIVADGQTLTLRILQGGAWHYAVLQGAGLGVTSVAAGPHVGSGQPIWAIIRDATGGTGHQVRGFSCPVMAQPGGTVTCLSSTPPPGQPSIGSGAVGFLNDLDGSGGGEKLSFPSVLSRGLAYLPAPNTPVDLFISETGNQAVRRHYGDFTSTVTGVGSAGFLDGAAAQAQLNLPAALSLSTTARSSSRTAVTIGFEGWLAERCRSASQTLGPIRFLAAVRSAARRTRTTLTLVPSTPARSSRSVT